MSIQLTVDPRTLKHTAYNMSSRKQTIQHITDEMLRTVNSLGSDWSGDAQRIFVRKFNSLNGDMHDIQRKLAEHVSDLLAIASNVEFTEQQTRVTAQSLGTDFVQIF